MKFTIEIEDFYIEEGDIESSLKDHIKADVVSQIYAKIKDKVDEHITRRVKADVEEKMHRFMNVAIEEIIRTEKFTYNREEISLSDYIKKEFANNQSYRTPTETIQKLAKQFADEMKGRYDLLFASQLVAKMSNNGMLKEDVAKILLDSNPK